MKPIPTTVLRAPVLWVGLSILFASIGAKAASTDIAPEPIISRANIAAKPNLMFVLDDSGSMARNYMPDDIDNFSNYTSTYGYRSVQCNGLAFDPALPYVRPIRADGTSYDNSSFSAAWDDGYNTGAGTTNLNNSFYFNYTTAAGNQPKMAWTYNSSGIANTGTTFYKECASEEGSTPGSAKFTRVTVTTAGSTADLKQRYANWYSYYRTRTLLMRTAVGLAVQALDSTYRVGFARINQPTITDGTNFRDAKPFDTTQRTNFYSSLYSANANGATPLRGALAQMGRYYAKKVAGQTYDPVQYSCQRNYTLLTTDGYWNSGGTTENGTSYGPLDLTGNAVGNQDKAEVRPMYDGTPFISTAVTDYTTVSRKQTITKPRTTVSSSRVATVVSTPPASDRCRSNELRRRVINQTLTVVTTQTVTTVFDYTEVLRRTVVTTDGTVTSNTTSNLTPVTTVIGTPVTTSDTPPSNWVNGNTTTNRCVSNLTLGTTYSNPNSTTTTSQAASPVTTTQNVNGPTAGATQTTETYSGGTSDTLADVAQYYYKTDLRTTALGNCISTSSGTSRDVCPDIVPTSGRDDAKTQHMTTFTVGLGVSGTLDYKSDYLKQTAAFCAAQPSGYQCDYLALTNGSKNWPAPTTVLSGNSGDARNIDDLWHAAVNGRGNFYSALDATALSQAITGVVDAIKEADGSGAASSFNTLSFVSGDTNRIYQASYTTSTWVGDVKALPVTGSTGQIGAAPVWSAQALLDVAVPSSRQIWYRQSQASATLRSFDYANLSADGLGSHFANLCSRPSQCAGLTTTPVDNVALANSGANLVNYLRGDRTYDADNPVSPLYRKRTHVLGDIISGAPVYVGKPPFGYADGGYAAFAASKANRTKVVYAGANDGMLHAFNAVTGVEMWAYVPTAVMPKMFKLAHTSYGSNHEYFVDGEPVVGDIVVGGVWKTILVGGLNSGGKAYYALDITDPLVPKSLWEFTDTNLGLTFGNPIITKRADGTWIVAVTSGYNNDTGDGRGHLFILNANTGAKLLDIATSEGTAGSPSGLAKINAWIDIGTNNTAKRFYGGDLYGNLWRFDIDNVVAPNRAALRLAQLQTTSGLPQPVTTRPETVLVSKLYPVVLVGTGQYLGFSDISTTDQQSLYAIKDPLTNTSVGVVRSNPSVVRQTLTVSSGSVTSTPVAVDWNTKSGWWFDLPNSGERIISSMAMQSGVLTTGTAVPSGDACTSGGSSWFYRINITTGGALADQPIGKRHSTKALIVGFTAVKMSEGDNGEPATSGIFIKTSDDETQLIGTGVIAVPGSGPARRTSWRELIN